MTLHISPTAEKMLLDRYAKLCAQMDDATAKGDFRPGWAEAIRKEMAILLPMLKLDYEQSAAPASGSYDVPLKGHCGQK